MRIVVKVGTSTLAHATGALNIRRTAALCRVLSDVKNAGHELVLVSSGAIGVGMGKLGLPQPDAVIYLDMPTEQAVRLLRSREASTHTKGDIHEVDTGYLALCRKTALRAADCLGWVKIPCVDGAGALRSMEDIHRDIWAAAARILG